MSFASKSGCPMCGIVASAVHAPAHTPASPSFPGGSNTPEVVWRDDNFTVYRERAHPVSSKGHLIFVFNLHVPSLYTLSASDLPLLVTIRDLGRRLLTSLVQPAENSYSANSPITANSSRFLNGDIPATDRVALDDDSLRIGFISPPFRDNKIPVTDHLHAHAYILPADLMGWWRGVGYSGLAWYAIDDLIAEIREETSNNRIRSGPKPKHAPRPIDQVPAAGARQGLSNGVETTHTGLGIADPEDPERSPGARPLSLNVNLGGPSWSSGAEPAPPLRRSPSAMSHVELLSPHQRHATGS
ncbi:hypothetical protein PHLGIDRAFT_124846 [Phlebiopsis gigantea 11061_1 CR5-6]|uniref:HIT domain-containing protein n=1 Tax=Phlebiopsis gigantea (strain 11061_1 CR5-6) TaxID=745531 RepID=A0A0C3PUR1_PHLG1|nr:hypothetical protein PHLGIDRAFT_124846 [Phlebiopsis gigantea 11061_1 CR5-6]